MVRSTETQIYICVYITTTEYSYTTEHMAKPVKPNKLSMIKPWFTFRGLIFGGAFFLWGTYFLVLTVVFLFSQVKC